MSVSGPQGSVEPYNSQSQHLSPTHLQERNRFRGHDLATFPLPAQGPGISTGKKENKRDPEPHSGNYTNAQGPGLKALSAFLVIVSDLPLTSQQRGCGGH